MTKIVPYIRINIRKKCAYDTNKPMSTIVYDIEQISKIDAEPKEIMEVVKNLPIEEVNTVIGHAILKRYKMRNNKYEYSLILVFNQKIELKQIRIIRNAFSKLYKINLTRSVWSISKPLK